MRRKAAIRPTGTCASHRSSRQAAATASAAHTLVQRKVNRIGLRDQRQLHPRIDA